MNKRCMLIILLLCVLKTSGQSEELTDEDYNTSYDDYGNSNESSKEISPVTDAIDTLSIVHSTETLTSHNTNQESELTTLSTIDLTVSTEAATKIIDTSTTDASKVLPCPNGCKCSDEFDLVDCSHQNFMQIPTNLPYKTVQLNLSHNRLKTFNVSDLIKCTELRQLFLNDNQIETIINVEEFSMLPGLHHIDLSSNQLKPLQGHEFTMARGLATLLLANNENVVQPNVQIVQTHKLKTLNLANCSITQLSDNIFQNLSHLLVLDLDSNPIDLAQSVKSFKYLVNLRTLNIPTVSRDVVLDLCKSLESIDIIHLTKETFDISCFLLSSGSTYEESTVQIGQTTLSTADIESNGLYKVVTNLPPSKIKITTTEKAITSINIDKKDLSIEEPKVQSSEQQISSFSQNESKSERPINATDTIELSEGTTQAKVDVPQHIIYMLLIGLITLTLVALLIGVCCRMDCCGIKTKCCRRRHNRAEIEDRMQPHEEIPLNKV